MNGSPAAVSQKSTYFGIPPEIPITPPQKDFSVKKSNLSGTFWQPITRMNGTLIDTFSSDPNYIYKLNKRLLNKSPAVHPLLPHFVETRRNHHGTQTWQRP